MTDRTFTNGDTSNPVDASWLQDVNNKTYRGVFQYEGSGVTSYAALRSNTVISGRQVYLNGGVTTGDGAQGIFRGVIGAAASTYVDNGGTIIVPTGGDGSAAWLRVYYGDIDARWFLAKLDGTTPDEDAISAAATLAGPNGMVLISGGTARISTNASVSTNVKFVNASVSIDSGVTLTVDGLINAPKSHIFVGSGIVSVSIKTNRIFPEWWGSVADVTVTDSYPGLTAAAACSSANGNILEIDGQYAIASTFVVPGGVVIEASRLSVIQPQAGSSVVNGILLDAGPFGGTSTLPQITGFTGIGLEIRNNLVEAYVPKIFACGTAIKFTCGASGVTSNVLDSIITFGQIAQCDIGVEFNCNFPTDAIQGSGVIGNFMVRATTPFKFSGVAARSNGFFIDLKALDVTTGGGVVLLNAVPSYTISFLRFKVLSWFGGEGFTASPTPTQFVSGIFVRSTIELPYTLLNQTNYTPGLIRGSQFNLINWTSKSGAYQLVTLADGLAGFNGGVMIADTQFNARVALTSALAAGEYIDMYFYHIFADSDYPGWTAIPSNMDSGVGSVALSIIDQNNTTSGQVLVRITNNTSVSIPSNTTINITLFRR